jgi:hypothetical protein
VQVWNSATLEMGGVDAGRVRSCRARDPWLGEQVNRGQMNWWAASCSPANHRHRSLYLLKLTGHQAVVRNETCPRDHPNEAPFGGSATNRNFWCIHITIKAHGRCIVLAKIVQMHSQAHGKITSGGPSFRIQRTRGMQPLDTRICTTEWLWLGGPVWNIYIFPSANLLSWNLWLLTAFASWSQLILPTDDCWYSRLTWDDTWSRTLIKGINVPCFFVYDESTVAPVLGFAEDNYDITWQ